MTIAGTGVDGTVSTPTAPALPTTVVTTPAPVLPIILNNTNPQISLGHIFDGEINKRGNAVGFHDRPGGVDPADARMTQLLNPPDANGVYEGKVEVRDPSTGKWVAKSKPSTFFPDNLSQQQITDAVLQAFKNSGVTTDGQFRGASGLGFDIAGWYRGGNIVTAYPIRQP